jgi:hypothetical protein|nr:MAG TPA: hypothetical protein [Caudoviricetes sp.]
MNNYKSFSELKEELGNNYDFKLYEMGISALKEIENLQQENKQLKGIIKENTILVKDEYGDYQECNINPLRMKQKYEKQVDNWNKLKEIAKSQSGFKKRADLKGGLWFEIDELLDKMQELERESDKNE